MGLIWGTVLVALGCFWGVRLFSFRGVNLGHCIVVFRWFSGSYAIFLYGASIRDTEKVVLGELVRFHLYGVVKGHCSGGFWGIRPFS
jgi:hypothetical protein